MPADNVEGLRADTLALLRELKSPIYRWPGGNFVSGYDWRDGIGDRDRRPPRVNPAWTGVEAPLSLSGLAAAGPAESWRIAGKDPMAFNDPDAPAAVSIESLGKNDLGTSLRLAPYSATVIRVPVKPCRLECRPE